MIAWLAAMALAAPVAVWTPQVSGVAQVGGGIVSVADWRRDTGIAATYTGGAVGLHAARRFTLREGSRGWSGQATVAVGIEQALYANSTGLALTPALSWGRLGDRGQVAFILASPSVAMLRRTADGRVPELRLPVSAEVQGGPRFRFVGISARAAGGVVRTPGFDGTPILELGLVGTVDGCGSGD